MAYEIVTADNTALEEDRDLFEMANLYPRTTGLPVTVWVSPRGQAGHDVRVKVSLQPGNRMDLHDTAVVGVRPEPAVLHGELPAALADLVFRWIELNAPVLVAYWNGEIDTVELVGGLQKI